MRILVPVDGSAVSLSAVRHAAKLANSMTETPTVVVLYVDPPLLRSVALDLGVKGVAAFHDENCAHAVKTAKTALNRAGVEHEVKMLVGEPAPTIIKHAKASKTDLVVMGSHGRGALKSVFLGSVTIKVLSQTDVPVTVVRKGP
jgi:nucleotide-binding universal stress UspA family protein